VHRSAFVCASATSFPYSHCFRHLRIRQHSMALSISSLFLYSWN